MKTLGTGTCARCGLTIYLHEHDGAPEWCSQRTPTNVCGESGPHVAIEVEL